MRIVQRLLRDRPSQFAIGLFVATFVHTLLAIREVDLGSAEQPGHVPGVAVITTFALAWPASRSWSCTSTMSARPFEYRRW